MAQLVVTLPECTEMQKLNEAIVLVVDNKTFVHSISMRTAIFNVTQLIDREMQLHKSVNQMRLSFDDRQNAKY